MKIIKATKKDIPSIQAIADAVWPPTFGEILSPEQISYMMEMMYSTPELERQMDRPGSHYMLVRDDGELRGYLSYELHYKSKLWTKVHKIYILPSAQGTGAGRFLIEEAESIARGNGDIELSLNVNRHNRAVGFYFKMGFEIIGEEDIDIGNGFFMNDYVMNKKL